MKAIAIPSAGGIAGRGDSDALVGDWGAASRARELTDDPAIGQLIIQNNGIAGAAGLTELRRSRSRSDEMLFGPRTEFPVALSKT